MCGEREWMNGAFVLGKQYYKTGAVESIERTEKDETSV